MRRLSGDSAVSEAIVAPAWPLPRAVPAVGHFRRLTSPARKGLLVAAFPVADAAY